MLTNYLKNNDDDEGLAVSAIELAIIYHNIKHNLSYNSLDCGIRLQKHIFKDVKIIKKNYLGRTKAESIVRSVLSKKALAAVTERLSSGNTFFAIQVDAMRPMLKIENFFQSLYNILITKMDL